MNVDKIIQLRLLKSNFNKLDCNNRYSVLYVDSKNYLYYLKDLLHVSKMMRDDFDWDGIPTEETLHSRFKHNSHCLFWLLDDSPIGCAWSNYNVTPYWEESIQELNENEIYGGGAFLSKKVDRPSNSGLIFYNLTFDYWLNQMGNDCIYQYSDDWNRVSSILSYKNGFEKFNFIK